MSSEFSKETPRKEQEKEKSKFAEIRKHSDESSSSGQSGVK